MPIQLASGAEPVAGYTLERRLGRGGFGEVWKAIGPGDFPIAIKFVQLEDSTSNLKTDELEVLRTIRHGNLLDVQFAYFDDGYLILGMPLCDQDLRGRLKACQKAGMQGIPFEELSEYMRDAARGLDFLHKQGVVHRDVKPANMFLRGECVVVADFGLVKIAELESISHTGSGTPQYSAPEMYSSRVHFRSDQFSLAVSYCELRTGMLPFQADNRLGLMHQICSGTPNLDKLEPSEAETVRRALAKEPADRFPSCQEFVQTLRACYEPVVEPAVTVELEEKEQFFRSNVLKVPDDYSTVGEAFRTAKIGDTVEIQPGRYAVQHDLPEGVTLVGIDREQCILQPTEYARYVIRVNQTRSASIRNLTFDGRFQTFHEFQTDGIHVANASVTIKNCIIQHFNGCGISVLGSRSSSQISGNTVADNQIHGISFSDGAGGRVDENRCHRNQRSGIAVLDTGTAPQLVANICSFNGRDGIWFLHGSGGIAENNTCEENEYGGILVSDVETSPDLISNRCTANKRDGIWFLNGAGGSVKECECTGNGFHGILVSDRQTSPHLITNQCTKNLVHGICFNDGARGVAERNACLENGQSGILVTDFGTSPRLVNNRCHRNQGWGIQASKRGNWEGYGNEASENVDGQIEWK